jgi:hypothetical protein
MMHDTEMDLTVILSYKGSCHERRANMEFTLAWHRRLLPAARFIVAEQDTQDGPWEGAERISWKSDDGLFNRGRCLNLAAAAARSRWLMILDGDALVDPGMARNLDELLRPGRPAFPFNRARFLTPEETRGVLDSGRVPPPTEGTQLVNVHISLALLVEREMYYRIGGFEELKGWGCEEVLFWRKMKHSKGVFHRPRGGNTLITHMWHPPAGTAEWRRSPQFRANGKEWARVRCMRPQQLDGYIHERRSAFEAAYGEFKAWNRS